MDSDRRSVDVALYGSGGIARGIALVVTRVSDHLQHEAEFRGDKVVLRRSEPLLVICGVGALGSHLVELLASQGYTNLRVIDKDRVEASNFGTQNYTATDIGRMKAQQCAIRISRKFKSPIEVHSHELRKSNANKLLRGAVLVVDLFDNAGSRNLVRDYCREHKIPCLHSGMSTDGFAEIEWNENYRAHPTPEGDENIPCEYPLSANLVALTVGLTAEVINRFVDANVKQSLHFTLQDLHIHDVSIKTNL